MNRLKKSKSNHSLIDTWMRYKNDFESPLLFYTFVLWKQLAYT